MTDHRECTKCRQVLPLSEFSPDSRTALGVGSHCKPCQRRKTTAYRTANPEKVRESLRLYGASNREALNAANKAWREANRQTLSQKKSEKYFANRETALAYQRRYRAEKREKINARQRLYYSTRQSEHRDRQREWRRKNPDKLLANLKNRRAKKCGATKGGLTAAQWREIMARFDNRCAYCGERPQKLTQDHFVPLSRGGSHTADNVVPACLSCNCKKWANNRDVLPEFRSLINV